MRNYKSTTPSTGIFVPDGNGYSELGALLGDGSINDITIQLGYHPDQVFGYFDTKMSASPISLVNVEIFTRNILFVLAPGTTQLSAASVEAYMQGFEPGSVYPSYVAESILRQGLRNKSLHFDFLARALDLGVGDGNGIVYTERLELYLYFIDGTLVDFQASDGLNEWAKVWKQKNLPFLMGYYRVASKYWPGRPRRVLAEINAQAEAWANIPLAMKNEFIPLHTTEHGIINFVMLRVCHYSLQISEEEFTTINHGRYHELPSGGYRLGRFDYRFNDAGQLVDCYPYS